jgi:predicted extracellular nuclease
MPRFAHAFLTLLAAGLIAATPAAAAPSPDVVISQVYGGGGNAGATHRNDFVELFNRGSSPVSLAGWSVQYGSATSATGAWSGKTSLTGAIAPGEHYLVQEGAGAGNGVALPAPDASGSIAMSAASGRVALTDTTATLACANACAGTAAVRDFTGYGAAPDYEGAGPAPTLTNSTADLRAAGGCVDSDDNAADFASGTPSPRNSASARVNCEAPRVTSTNPPNGGADVPLDGNLEVTFSQPVDAGPGAFSLQCTTSGAHTLAVSGGPETFTLDPQEDFARGETCTLTVHAADVSDRDTGAHPAGDSSTTFGTVGLELRIHDIQGAAHISPHAGDRVSFVPGVVTAVSRTGFWFQDTEADADERTSEGLFVFTRSAPAAAVVPGAAVKVSGRVSEFRGAASGLSTTEIVDPLVTVDGTGTVAPTIVGRGGRVPPAQTIEDDASGDVEAQSAFDPEQDGIDFHESLEGMLVQINDAVAVGPSVAFGEIPVVADGGADARPRTNRGGVVVTAQDFNPERLMLDDVIAPTPTAVDVRDGLGTVRAVVDYSFGNFKYEVTETPQRTSGGLEREVTAAPRADQLAIASFNVENLDPGDGPAKFDKLAAILVHNLRAPDLVAVEEIQDNDGPGTAPSTDASATWDLLIAAIVAQGGPRYEYRQIDPAYGTDGGEPGGNIRQGFLLRTDRGLAFVDRPGGTATTATDEDASRRGAQLTFSPGRIQPQDPAFDNSRKPLAGEFRWKGRPLFVIANHFNSKGGDDPLFGRRQPPVRSSEVQRHQQATIVNAFVRDLQRADPLANIVVLGDLNDFEFSETLDILQGRELVNLFNLLPRAERYSYVFEGNSQVLDQVLVSWPMLLGLPQYDSVHVNSEFHDQDSDHDPQVARLRPVGGGSGR